MINDVSKKLSKTFRRDVFQDFPSGDEVEAKGISGFEDGEWFRDVGGEEVGAGQVFPIGAFVAQGVIGAFQADGLPAEVFEVFDELSTGAAEVHEGFGAAP